MIHRLFITTVSVMVFWAHHMVSQFTMSGLLCLCVVAGSVRAMGPMALEEHYCVEGQRHDDLDHKARVKFVHNEKRDTLQRDNSAARLISTYSSLVPLSPTEPVTVDRSDQTTKSASSCPLHQQISIYRL